MKLNAEISKVKAYIKDHAEVHILEAANTSLVHKEIDRRHSDILNIVEEKDRRYEERHRAAQSALDRAFEVQQKALGNAFESAQAAIKHEHEVTEGKLENLTKIFSFLESRLKDLEIAKGIAYGRREPLSDFAKWGIALICMILFGILGHFIGK